MLLPHLPIITHRHYIPKPRSKRCSWKSGRNAVNQYNINWRNCWTLFVSTAHEVEEVEAAVEEQRVASNLNQLTRNYEINKAFRSWLTTATQHHRPLVDKEGCFQQTTWCDKDWLSGSIKLPLCGGHAVPLFYPPGLCRSLAKASLWVSNWCSFIPSSVVLLMTVPVTAVARIPSCRSIRPPPGHCSISTNFCRLSRRLSNGFQDWLNLITRNSRWLLSLSVLIKRQNLCPKSGTTIALQELQARGILVGCCDFAWTTSYTDEE